MQLVAIDFGVLSNFTNTLLGPLLPLIEFVSAIYEFITTIIDSIIIGFQYIISSGQNIVFYNSFVPALFGGVVVAFVVVAIVKAIFGR